MLRRSGPREDVAQGGADGHHRPGDEPLTGGHDRAGPVDASPDRRQHERQPEGDAEDAYRPVGDEAEQAVGGDFLEPDGPEDAGRERQAEGDRDREGEGPDRDELADLERARLDDLDVRLDAVEDLEVLVDEAIDDAVGGEVRPALEIRRSASKAIRQIASTARISAVERFTSRPSPTKTPRARRRVRPRRPARRGNARRPSAG
jgi:hypothetical protein